jgi:hypothetical protein
MRKIKAVILLFAFGAILAGGVTLTTATKVEAARCCWVMYCSPIGCWEVCKPCPKF